MAVDPNTGMPQPDQQDDQQKLPPFSDYLAKTLQDSLRRPPMEIPKDMQVQPQELNRIPDDMRVDVAEGQPPVTGTDADKATPWYNNVIKKLKDTFVDQETEGTVSRELREQMEYHLGGRAHTDLLNSNYSGYEAFTRMSHELLYSTARVLEGTMNLMNDAIRAVPFGEEITDPGLQATVQGIGPPGALVGGALASVSKLGSVLGLGKVKATGGVLDAINLDRAKDMGVLGNKPPEIFMKGDQPMTPKEMADAVVREPTAAYPSNTHMDATVDRNLFMDESGAVKVPTWEDIHGTFVKAEPGNTLGDKIASAIKDEQEATKYQFVDIAAIHKRLPDVPLEDLKKELKSEATKEGGGRFELYRQDNQKVLTDADREAAVQIGSEPRHKVFLNEFAGQDKVRVHTDPSAMIDGDKPVEGAAKQLGREVLGDEFKGTGRELYSALAKELGPEVASQRLSAAGVHGIRVEGEAIKSAAVKIGDKVYEGNLHMDAYEEAIKQDPSLDKLTNSELEAKAAEGFVTTRGRFVGRREAQDMPRGEGEKGHVVFDQRLVESLNVDGKPVPPPPGRPPGEPPPKPAGGVVTDPTGNIRADVWKGIADVKDVRALVEQANIDNGGFPQARAGQIPIEHAEAISNATGIPLHEVVSDLSHNFNNPGKVRATMQALHDTAHQWWQAAVKAVGGNDVDSLIAYKEQQLQHELVQEYTTAKLAEAGRSLAVPQEFYGQFQQRPLKAEPPKPKPKAEGAAEEKPTFSNRDGLKEFREKVKDRETLEGFLKAKGESIDDLRAEAKRISELNPDSMAVSKAGATRLRARELETRPWYEKLYRESLVSGVFSHSRYLLAGVVRNGLNSTVVPAFNAAVNSMQAAMGKQFLPEERARFGEINARFMTGHTEALEAMWQQMKTGIRPPLPGQVKYDAKGNPLPSWPGGGPFMNAVGSIHTFHGYIGYAGEIKARAYRRAVEEGFTPGTGAFSQRMAEAVSRPTPQAIEAALKVADNMSLTTPLGKVMGPISAGFHNMPGGFLMWTFNHVPVVVVKKGVEYTPGLQLLSKDLRADVMGRNGGLKQSVAFGKLVTGHAILATAAVLAANDQLTDSGPIDPKAHAEWIQTHMPNAFSFSKTGRWFSYDGWGPASIAIGWSASLASIGSRLQAYMRNPNVTEADKKARQQEFTEAWGLASHAVGHMIDEAGLRQIVDFIHMTTGTDSDSGHALDRGMKGLVGSLIPSFFGQIAAFGDPWQRRVDTTIDALKARMPGSAFGWGGRQSLPVRTDWLGLPMANPRQGFGALVPNMERDRSAINLELQRLDIKPILMPKELQTVPLDPGQRAELQVTFGTLARNLLNPVMADPTWKDKPDNVRTRVITALLNAARIQATQTFMLDPKNDILRRSIEDKVQAAKSGKPRPDMYQRPD